MKERDNYIDALRSVGLFLIILAHIAAPFSISQIRCFDVPLMVFVSGLCYGEYKCVKNIEQFIIKRIFRLLIPTYLFIIAYSFLLYIIGGKINLTTFLYSLLLFSHGSIGYVWIIRVFVIITVITPFLIKLKNSLSLSWLVIISIVSLSFNELFCIILHANSSTNLMVSECTIMLSDIICYGLIFLWGAMFRQLNHKNCVKALSTLLLACAGAFFYYVYHYGCPIDITSSFKTPPRIFYVIYGITISSILWVFRKQMKPFVENVFFVFVGQNTIWIYFWHTIPVIIANKYISCWGIRYVFVLATALLCYYIQYKIINKIQIKRHLDCLKYLKG